MKWLLSLILQTAMHHIFYVNVVGIQYLFLTNRCICFLEELLQTLMLSMISIRGPLVACGFIVFGYGFAIVLS